MIESVDLVSIPRRGLVSAISPNEWSLWPKEKKAQLVEANFSTDAFYFKVTTTTDASTLSVVLNGWQSFPLTRDLSSSTCEFKSTDIYAKSFLSGNLGIYELQLDIDGMLFPLTNLKNVLAQYPRKQIRLMYECVADSEFFSLFISAGAASSAAKLSSEKDDQNNFWHKSYLARSTLAELDRFLSRELTFTHRLQVSSSVERYGGGSRVGARDLRWLMGNPNELYLAVDGPVSLMGRSYNINRISQSKMVFDFDTYENRLLISTLYDMRACFFDMLPTTDSDGTFPVTTVSRLVASIDQKIDFLRGELSLSPPFDTVPTFSNKYHDDMRYHRIFELISQWFFIKTLEQGNEFNSPIPNITKIFEHFCFIQIFKCLRHLGFEPSQVESNTTGYETEILVLQRGGEQLEIHYDKKIKRSGETIKMSRAKTSYLRPDLLFVHRSPKGTKIGVVDAKFSDKNSVAKTWGPAIYYKYGSFLHKADGTLIDYVYAAYPSMGDGGFSTWDERHPEYEEHPLTRYGAFSISLHDAVAPDMVGFIEKLLLVE